MGDKTSYRLGKYSNHKGIVTYHGYGIQHMGYKPVAKPWHVRFSIEISIVLLLLSAAVAIMVALNI